MYNTIQTEDDIRYFYEKTNQLHDGYIIDMRYENNGIQKIENGHRFEAEKTKLILKILVTSIWDTVVEIEFENLFEWQIKQQRWEDIYATTVKLGEQNQIVWWDGAHFEDAKDSSYVIAESMRWRIAP